MKMDFVRKSLEELNNDTLNDIMKGDAKQIINNTNFYAWNSDLIILGLMILAVSVLLYFLNSPCWWIVLLIGIAIIIMLNYASTFTIR
jgi:hypothetical protein